MKKFRFLAALFVLPAVMCFAQIKPYVCTVHEVFYDKTQEYLTNFSSNLRHIGERAYADAIDNFLNGGAFGSGFVYVGPNGKNYVITNRHVVESAKTLTVDFIDENGGKVSYEGLKIVAIGQDIDIAVLEFPAGSKPFTRGVTFATGRLSDGDDVYTAGFPAFEGKPSWQFGTGTVTNSSASIESLVNPEISTVIQHSAQIDSGSSGGPLLVKSNSATGGYAVVGMNTWKATNRQDTNFSIPAKVIQDFVNDAISGKLTEPDTVEAVSKRAAKFAKVISNKDATYDDVLPFISMEYVAEYGPQTFNYALDVTSGDTFKTILSTFLYESPIEGMRYAIAWDIFHEFHLVDRMLTEEYVSEFTTPEKDAETGHYKTTFTLPYEGGEAYATWVNTYGSWQLFLVEAKTGKDRLHAIYHSYADKVGPLYIFKPYQTSIFGGVYLSNDMGMNNPVHFGMDIGFGYYTGFLYDLTFANFTDTYGDQSLFLSFDVAFRLGLPVLLGDFVLEPYAAAGAGYYLYGTNFDISYNLRAGGRAAFIVTPSFTVFGDAAYVYKSSIGVMKSGDEFKTSGLSITAGIAF